MGVTLELSIELNVTFKALLLERNAKLLSISGPYGETTVTRWVDTDVEWWLGPLVETRIRIEADGVHGGKREVHEITVTHDSGTSVSVETKPVREWDRLPSTTTTTYNTLSRALEWRK